MSSKQLAAAAAKSLQSCPTLCDPRDGSPWGSPAPGILQARTLEWVAISFSNAGKWKSESEVTQMCPTLSDPMDCSLPGSSIHGSVQARVLEWVPLNVFKKHLPAKSLYALSDLQKFTVLAPSWLDFAPAHIPPAKSDTLCYIIISVTLSMLLIVEL